MKIFQAGIGLLDYVYRRSKHGTCYLLESEIIHKLLRLGLLVVAPTPDANFLWVGVSSKGAEVMRILQELQREMEKNENL